MRYFLISMEDAVLLGVDGFRRGGDKGFIVNEGDLAVSPDVMKRAVEVSSREATNFINNL